MSMMYESVTIDGFDAVDGRFVEVFSTHRLGNDGWTGAEHSLELFSHLPKFVLLAARLFLVDVRLFENFVVELDVEHFRVFAVPVRLAMSLAPTVLRFVYFAR